MTAGPVRRQVDVLVAGSGIAGLTFALKAAEAADVLLVTKKDRAHSNTNYAQGGVAAAWADDDSPDLHRRDTLLAGAGLCHDEVVERVSREGPERVRELMDWGVRFSRDGGEVALGREAGHSRRRILHAADLTGREIERALLEAVAASPRIELLEDHFLWSLHTEADPSSSRPRCIGGRILDVETGVWLDVAAAAVLLATGGSGRLYRHTTNPTIASGDGVSLATEAGAAVANLEFVQFHPTALYPAGSHAFLISEAMRGEGAVLRTRDGRAFMEDHHPAGSLAPRDVVARAADAEMKRAGDPHVWLDASSLPAEVVRERFPTIHAACADRGIRLPEDPIPVVPAAHYQCGGVLTDGHGRTTLAGLYAAGEVACTGLHGANRLASNSLLEAVVLAHRAARHVRSALPRRPPSGTPPDEPEPLRAAGTDPEALEAELRDLMWERVGIVRSHPGLEGAERALEELASRPPARDGTGLGALRARETEFLLRVARLVVRCALARRESRGLHFTETYPFRDNERFLRDTVVGG